MFISLHKHVDPFVIPEEIGHGSGIVWRYRIFKPLLNPGDDFSLPRIDLGRESGLVHQQRNVGKRKLPLAHGKGCLGRKYSSFDNVSWRLLAVCDPARRNEPCCGVDVSIKLSSKHFEFYSGYVMLPDPNATKAKVLTSSEAIKRMDMVPYQRILEFYQLGIKPRTFVLLLAVREHPNRYHAGQGR